MLEYIYTACHALLVTGRELLIKGNFTVIMPGVSITLLLLSKLLAHTLRFCCRTFTVVITGCSNESHKVAPSPSVGVLLPSTSSSSNER
jgi:hypothetical protein